MNGRHKSDHVILRWCMPICPEVEPDPIIPTMGPEAKKYSKAISEGIERIADIPIEDKDDLERVGELLQEIMDKAFWTHAKKPRKTKYSKLY